jgi:hypothetical protein
MTTSDLLAGVRGAAAAKLNPVQLRAIQTFSSLPDPAGLPVPVAGALLTVSDVTVWRYVKSGLLDAFRVGGSTRITAGSIRRVMAGNKPTRMENVTAASVAARRLKAGQAVPGEV